MVKKQNCAMWMQKLYTYNTNDIYEDIAEDTETMLTLQILN